MSNHRAVAPPGMKHVAWFCEHRDGTWNPEKKRTEKERPHYESRRKADGTWKAKKRHEVLSAITTADSPELADGKPVCPDAIPLFAIDDAYIPPRVWSMSETNKIPHDVTVKDQHGNEWAWGQGMHSSGWHSNGRITAFVDGPNPHCAPFTELIRSNS